VETAHSTPRTEETSTTQERILDAAEECIGRYGLRRVSMADVAARAGLSRGSVYLHFADRAALVDAVLGRVAVRFVASSEPAVRRRRTLAGQVAEAAVFIREHVGDELLTLHLQADDESLVATVLTAQIHRLVAQWVEFWIPFLIEAQNRGEVRADLDLARAGEWIVRLLLSFAVMPSVSVNLDNPDVVRAFVRDHLVAGLAA